MLSPVYFLKEPKPPSRCHHASVGMLRFELKEMILEDLFLVIPGPVNPFELQVPLGGRQRHPLIGRQRLVEPPLERWPAGRHERPLVASLVFGLVAAVLVVILVLPAVYTILDDLNLTTLSKAAP